MNEPGYIESSTAARVKLGAVLLAILAVGFAFERWVLTLLAWVASLPTCDSLPWVRLELLFLVFMCWYLGYAAFKQGRGTWSLGQTPLPNTWVWSRTEVRTGSYAKFAAVAAFATSALFLLGPPFIIVWQKLYLIFCFPQSCGCE